MREFIFKFLNNLLATNTKMSHYINGRARGCSFCSMAAVANIPDETMRHLFFECQTVTTWRLGSILRQFPQLQINTVQFWFGAPEGQVQKNNYLQFFRWCFLYTVWDFKLRLKRPAMETFWLECNSRIERGLKISPLLRLKKLILRNHNVQAPARG